MYTYNDLYFKEELFQTRYKVIYKVDCFSQISNEYLGKEIAYYVADSPFFKHCK